MANELNVSLSLRFAKGNTRLDKAVPQFPRDVAGFGRTSQVQNIGTSHEAVVVGTDIASDQGYAFFRNLDDTNFIDIGPEVTGPAIEPFIRLQPGDIAFLRLIPDVTIRAVADTAACDLEYLIFQD